MGILYQTLELPVEFPLAVPKSRMKHRVPFRARPMLATLTSEPFDKAGWVYEEKYDGDRILAYKEDDRIRLLSRSGEDRTDRFPGIAQAILKLEPASLLLDGEVVVFDKRGVSRFQLLQQRGGEPSYAIFDCLFCQGKDLRGESLATRRTAMENAIGSSRVLLPSRRLATNGFEAFRVANAAVTKDWWRRISPPTMWTGAHQNG